MSNGTLNFDRIGVIAGANADKFVWKIEMQLFNELGEMAICVFAIGELRRMVVMQR